MIHESFSHSFYLVRFALACAIALSSMVCPPFCWGQQNARFMNLKQEEYSVLYDTQLNCPRQVRWLILPYQTEQKVKRVSTSFKADYRLPRPRVVSSDFTNSGFQRGHICPAADRAYSKAAMARTFLLSNICPQRPLLNVREWKATEIACRQMAQRYGRCSVAVAPIFWPYDTLIIGRHHVAVPHAFFKIAWVPGSHGTMRIWCYLNQ